MQCRSELCDLQSLLHPSHNLILLATLCHILGRHCRLPLTGEDMGTQRGYCGLNVYVPHPNSYVETSNPNVLVFGDGAFGR